MAKDASIYVLAISHEEMAGSAQMQKAASLEEGPAACLLVYGAACLGEDSVGGRYVEGAFLHR